MKGTYNVTVMFVNGEAENVYHVEDMNSTQDRVQLLSRPEGETKTITIAEFAWTHIIGYIVQKPASMNQPAGAATSDDPPDPADERPSRTEPLEHKA